MTDHCHLCGYIPKRCRCEGGAVSAEEYERRKREVREEHFASVGTRGPYNAHDDRALGQRYRVCREDMRESN